MPNYYKEHKGLVRHCLLGLGLIWRRGLLIFGFRQKTNLGICIFSPVILSWRPHCGVKINFKLINLGVLCTFFGR